MARQRKTAEDHQRTELQTRSWEYRQRGWTQARIARELGVDQGTISRWLRAIEDRELKQLSDRVARAKLFQSNVLEKIIEETMDAWEASKKPRQRVTRKPAQPITTKSGEPLIDRDGKPIMGEPQVVTEIISREGNRAFYDCAISALAHHRKLWGLDVLPKINEESGPTSVTAIAARLAENAAKHDSAPIDDESPEQVPPRKPPDPPGGCDSG